MLKMLIVWKWKMSLIFKYLISYVLKYIDLKLEAHELKHPWVFKFINQWLGVDDGVHYEASHFFPIPFRSLGLPMRSFNWVLSFLCFFVLINPSAYCYDRWTGRWLENHVSSHANRLLTNANHLFSNGNHGSKSAFSKVRFKRCFFKSAFQSWESALFAWESGLD